MDANFTERFGKMDYKGNMWWGRCPPVYSALQDTIDYDAMPYTNLWYGVLEFKACKHRMFAGYNCWNWPNECPECAGLIRTTQIVIARKVIVEKDEEGQDYMMHGEATPTPPIPVFLTEPVKVEEIMVKMEEENDGKMEYDEYYDGTLDFPVMDEKDEPLPVPVCYPPPVDADAVVSEMFDNVFAMPHIQELIRAKQERYNQVMKEVQQGLY